MTGKSVKYLRIALNPVAFARDRAKLQADIHEKDKRIEALQGEVEKKDKRIEALQRKVEALRDKNARLRAKLQPETRLKDAVKQYAAGEREAAEAFLEQVPPQDPIYGKALTQFARAAMKRKDWTEALKWWRAKVTAQEDDLAHAYTQMSAAYSTQGMLDEAIDLLVSAQERGLTNNHLHLQLARLFADKMQWEKAAELVNSILGEHESFFEELKGATFAARVLWRVGDISRASMIMERAMAKDDARELSLGIRAMANEMRRRSRESSELHSPEASAAYYDDIYRESRRYSKAGDDSVYSILWDEVVSRIKQGCYARILDIGCGPGQFAEYLLRQCPSIEYTGVDFSGVAVEIAKKRCPSATFIKADVFRTDILEKSEYDLILMLELLEHLENDVALLSRIPAGRSVVFSVPDSDAVAHVRFFPTEEAVSERYGSLFLGLEISRFSLSERTVIFLASGIKSDQANLSVFGAARSGNEREG